VSHPIDMQAAPPASPDGHEGHAGADVPLFVAAAAVSGDGDLLQDAAAHEGRPRTEGGVAGERAALLARRLGALTEERPKFPCCGLLRSAGPNLEGLRCGRCLGEWEMDGAMFQSTVHGSSNQNFRHGILVVTMNCWQVQDPLHSASSIGAFQNDSTRQVTKEASISVWR
jgi:hypothetical protein